MPTQPQLCPPTNPTRQPTWGHVRAAVDRLLEHQAHTRTTAAAPPRLFTVHAPAARPTQPRLYPVTADAAAWSAGLLAVVSALTQAVRANAGFLPAADIYGFALQLPTPSGTSTIVAVGRDTTVHCAGGRLAGDPRPLTRAVRDLTLAVTAAR